MSIEAASSALRYAEVKKKNIEAASSALRYVEVKMRDKIKKDKDIFEISINILQIINLMLRNDGPELSEIERRRSLFIDKLSEKYKFKEVFIVKSPYDINIEKLVFFKNQSQ